MKVFQAIADGLKSEGVQFAFALMGDANQNLIVDLAQRCGVRIVNFRHEQNAVAAADGYARFSEGKFGVALVTMGPGLTNTATSLAAARAHRSPVLVLAGRNLSTRLRQFASEFTERWSPSGWRVC
jgi:acetolactate synthase-1/2/3 large subunit